MWTLSNEIEHKPSPNQPIHKFFLKFLMTKRVIYQYIYIYSDNMPCTIKHICRTTVNTCTTGSCKTHAYHRDENQSMQKYLVITLNRHLQGSHIYDRMKYPTFSFLPIPNQFCMKFCMTFFLNLFSYPFWLCQPIPYILMCKALTIEIWFLSFFKNFPTYRNPAFRMIYPNICSNK